MKDMTQEQVLTYAAAVAELDTYGTYRRERDHIIRRAYAARVTKSEIARRMGIGRSTVDAVLGAKNSKGGDGDANRDPAGD